MENLLKSQLSRASGVSGEALRFYERKGLLPKPGRSVSGYRLYPSETVARLRFIRNAQQIGFSLNEVASMLGLKTKPGVTCAMVRHKVESKIGDVDQKLAALKTIRRALVKLKDSCRKRLPASECPILEHLEHGPWKGEKP